MASGLIMVFHSIFTYIKFAIGNRFDYHVTGICYQIWY